MTARKYNPLIPRLSKADYREYFRVGAEYFSCPGYSFDELRRWRNEYGELPDLSGMPHVIRLKGRPRHLSCAEIEDLTPRKAVGSAAA